MSKLITSLQNGTVSENKLSWNSHVEQNLVARRALYTESDEKNRAIIRKKASIDNLFFINYFCWTYDPRPYLKEHNLPFVLYPFQTDIIQWMEARFQNAEDGLIEKSRDMGVSWFALAFVLHKFLFHDGFTALLGSRKEDLVDNKNLDSLFGKVDFMLRRLPDWMLPVGFDIEKHRLYMKIHHPDGVNSIIGESTNEQFARSGRYSMILLDEFAFVENSWSIWRATADSSPVRFPVSTPNGKGNKFAELRHTEGIKVKSLHWTLHPMKDKKWYEKECERRTPEEVAQELDISYERSVKGQVFREELNGMRADSRICEVVYQKGLKTFCSIDFGIGDATSIGFYQVDSEGNVYFYDYYENSGFAIDHYIKKIKEKSYWQEISYYGDIAGEQRSLVTGTSVAQMMRKKGIYVRSKPVKKSAKFKNNTINAAKMLMKKMWINEKLVRAIDAFENYHYAFNERDNTYADLPVHNWASHCCDQFQYFAWNLRPNPQARDAESRSTAVAEDPLMTTSF